MRASICISLLLLTSVAHSAEDSYVTTVRRANAMLQTGRHTEALALYQSALNGQVCNTRSQQTQLANVVRRSPCFRTMMLLYNIALTHRAIGQPQKILTAYRFYLAQWRDKFPKLDHYPFAERAQYEIGQALFQQKQFSEALAAYRSSLRGWRQRYGEKVARFGDKARRRIAESLARLGRRSDAAEAYQHTLTVYRKQRGQAHPDQRHIEATIARLKQPARKELPPPPKPIPPKPRSRAWLIAAITTAGLAVASEALAVAFIVRGNQKFKGDPALKRDQNVTISGHVMAAGFAAMAIGSTLYYLKSGSPQAQPAKETGGEVQVGLWGLGASIRGAF